MRHPIVLGIETSCDETAAAVVRSDGLVLSDVKASQIDLFESLGGVVPEIAARAHTEKIIPVIHQALTESGLDWAQIDRIAVTKGPGLVGALLIGQTAARTCSFVMDKPLRWVNHLHAHLLACWLYDEGEARPRIRFPAIGLLVSGGHTELIWMQSRRRFEVVGATLDDAAGEAFDKVGKLLGLPYPGGPHVSRVAQTGNAQAYSFPRAMLRTAHLDMSFSGLKTAVLREVQRHYGLIMTDVDKAILVSDLAASFEEAVVDVLAQKTIKAVARYGPQSVLLAGGVAANARLRDRMREVFGDRLAMPRLSYCTDNAAMVAMG